MTIFLKNVKNSKTADIHFSDLPEYFGDINPIH